MSLLSPANGARRLSVPEYLALCHAHFRRYWKHYTIPLAVIVVLQFFIRIDVNYTDSLPDHAFVTVKGLKSNIKRGDYIAFGFPSDSTLTMFRKGDHLVKIVAGVAGDEVRMNDKREFEIVHADDTAVAKALGGHGVGKSKEYSRAGRKLDPGPVGVIPPDHYYVFAPHPDSLDSRYAITGWISKDDVIGKTFVLF